MKKVTEDKNEWQRFLEEEDFDVPLAVPQRPKPKAPIRTSWKQIRAVKGESDGR